MSHILYRDHLGDGMPAAVAGNGPYLTDAAGRRYLDASSGAAVSCLGHSNTAVRNAIKEQVDRLAFAHSRFFTTEPAERLADELVGGAPGNLDKVWFTCGGSEAIEAALKITRQYFVEAGQPQRRFVIARRQGYHGITCGALSVSGNLWRRRQFEPMLLTVTHHIAPCYAYRDQAPGETLEAYGLRVADELETRIRELGPENVAAFVAETVVGSTLGAVAATPGYFRRIREICDRHGVVLILDEIMCGMGRTGARWACDAEGIAPDMIAVAKGLAAGYVPLGALLVAAKIHRAIECGTNAIHGHTFMAHATACAAALATQGEIRDRNLLDNVVRMGDMLRAALVDRFGAHPNVGDIRGRGLFLALEFVADRRTRQPFDPALRINARIKERGMENGLICYPMGGIVEGRSGDHVMLAPPFIIDETHVAEIVDKLGRTVDSVLREALVRAA